jgi:chromatin modification-related protein YNG2
MDAATLLDYYTHDLTNLPDETRYFMDELRKKDLEYDKILLQIEIADSQLFKYIKQHGSLIRHPKEELITEEISKYYKEARKIQNEKILIANTALISISKYTLKFQKDVRRLVETGAIERWDLNDEDIEVVDSATGNPPLGLNLEIPSSVSVSTPPISGRSTVDINDITKKLNNSLIDLTKTKSTKKSSRDRTPINEDGSNISDFTPSRRRDVTAGTAIIKGPNRRVLSTNGTLSGKAEYGGNGDDDELYCFCQQVSYGEMVACDNPNCKYEWFHYDCVGLKEPPTGVWYCPDCRKDGKKDVKKDKKKKL